MLLNQLFESSQLFPKTIALVGGSFRPPTAGHLDMVKKYADMTDNVIVLISNPKSAKSIRKTNLGTVVTPEMAQEIWQIYIDKEGLKNKVDVIISPEPSPITALFKYADEQLKDVNVIFGASKKDGDENRFKSAMKYFEENPNINLLDPLTTAVEPYKSNTGKPISATDIRNSIDNLQAVRHMLPDSLSDEDISKIQEILLGNNMKNESILDDSLKPLDETEAIHIDISDDILNESKIMAYNVGQTVRGDKGKDIPVTPKKFPTKAIDIVFPVQQLLVEIFLDTKTKKWDSDIKYNGQHLKLSPDQFGQFFESGFYNKLQLALGKKWPLSDKLYGDLYQGVCNKEMKIFDDDPIVEDNDKEMSNKDVDGDGVRDYTPSGRRIVNFSDAQVSSKGAKFYCWPDLAKVNNWSTWKDWKKIKPLCRMRFKHGQNIYGLSLSTLEKDYDLRGFRGYDLTTQPPVQWLTKEENESLIKLSIVNKFIKHCIEKISKFLEKTPEQVFDDINRPDAITVEEIAKTMSNIRKTLKYVIKEH